MTASRKRQQRRTGSDVNRYRTEKWFSRPVVLATEKTTVRASVGIAIAGGRPVAKHACASRSAANVFGWML